MRRKLFTTFLVFFFFGIAYSQVPQGFNYQAIARDDSGNPIINTTLPVTITIQSDSLGGTIFWEELHSAVSTNGFGLLTLVVGKGARQSASTVSTFDMINWKVTPKFIKTQVFYKSQLLNMGSAKFWATPYSLVAGEIAGPVEKFEVAGKTTVMDEALFEVKNKDGNTVFAVYNEGVRIYVGEGLEVKGKKGGFAVGGFGQTKEGNQDYLVVNSDSIRAYIDNNATKGKKGGFAVGGFGTTKEGWREYLSVTSDSVKVSRSLLIPRLTTEERDNLPFTPGEALIIFNMTESCMQIYKNNVWSNIWCFNCAPDFLIQPVDKTICSGENAVFFVSATGTSLSYQWQQSSDNGNSWYNIYDGGAALVYSGCNSYTLSLTNVPVSHHNFKYRCAVMGSCLPNVTSNVVTLNVGSTPPSITSHPADQQLSSGCTASFSIVSPGYSVSYKWQQSSDGGNTWNNISDGGTSPVYSGSTAAILSLSNVPLTFNSYKYRCNVSNLCGDDIVSNIATLTVSTSLEIIVQPLNQMAYTGQNVSFNITVSGSNYIYRWQESTNGGSTWQNLTNGGSDPAYSGVNTSILSLSKVPVTINNYKYRCIVSHFCHPDAISDAATLAVPTPVPVTDIEGNTYNTVGIGSQLWMAENLKTTKYKDDTDIPLVANNTDWSNLTTPGYCWYNNDETTYKNIYGALYNWYTINTGKLCPTGWHVPTDGEWTILENYLIANGYNYDGTTISNKIGKAMASTTGWTFASDTGSVGNIDFPAYRNKSGFTALPSSYHYLNGDFFILGEYGSWWSSTAYSSTQAWIRHVVYNYVSVNRGPDYKKVGYSVRCVKD